MKSATREASPVARTTTVSTGISYRHSRRCKDVDRCRRTCGGTYEPRVYQKQDKKKVGPPGGSFPTLAAAKTWRLNALKLVADKKLRAPTNKTLAQEWDEWLEGARAGSIRKRNGERYKPAVLREYDRAMRLRVVPELGHKRASDVDRPHLLDLKERLLHKYTDNGRGVCTICGETDDEHRKVTDSTVANTFRPLQALYRRLQDRGIPTNPTRDLGLPTGYKRRERIATVDEAAELIAALPESERALWATAFYGGLRRGELRALRVENVNGEIRVEAGWDDVEGEQAPKSEKGKRTVPLPAILRPYIKGHIERTGRSGKDLVFGSTALHPFTPKNVRRKALNAWEAENKKRAEENEKRKAEGQSERSLLVPITLHEARHTYVTLMHAAGLSLEEIGDYVGHGSAYMTDRYRHLIEGREKDAASAFDAYLARASTASRLAQVEAAE
jgi:integrase